MIEMKNDINQKELKLIFGFDNIDISEKNLENLKNLISNKENISNFILHEDEIKLKRIYKDVDFLNGVFKINKYNANCNLINELTFPILERVGFKNPVLLFENLFYRNIKQHFIYQFEYDSINANCILKFDVLFLGRFFTNILFIVNYLKFLEYSNIKRIKDIVDQNKINLLDIDEQNEYDKIKNIKNFKTILKFKRIK